MLLESDGGALGDAIVGSMPSEVLVVVAHLLLIPARTAKRELSGWERWCSASTAATIATQGHRGRLFVVAADRLHISLGFI